ncbi:hypothetical protein [Paraburkholderia antibiotica]|uniref:Uncharacterized protein n=1 Tax=Paraburkholderia antibiotica TaxID=2728839 RepID=A0A7Y0A1R2_9BURK|nr:hypothetical protein [Paraburkholderia antibiotica]NML34885.1 hypothetical protein [Paraburkholderia antibiotica]
MSMPALNDAMRAVLRNQDSVYQTEDQLYAALCVAASPSANVAQGEREEEPQSVSDFLEELCIGVDLLEKKPDVGRSKVSTGYDEGFNDALDQLITLAKDLHAAASGACTPSANMAQGAEAVRYHGVCGTCKEKIRDDPVTGTRCRCTSAAPPAQTAQSAVVLDDERAAFYRKALYQIACWLDGSEEQIQKFALSVLDGEPTAEVAAPSVAQDEHGAWRDHPAALDAMDRVREALSDFTQQDDYFLGHGASIMSDSSHEIVHVDTVRKIVAAVHAASRSADQVQDERSACDAAFEASDWPKRSGERVSFRAGWQARAASPSTNVAQGAEAIGYVNSMWAQHRTGTTTIHPEPHPRLATTPVYTAPAAQPTQVMTLTAAQKWEIAERVHTQCERLKPHATFRSAASQAINDTLEALSAAPSTGEAASQAASGGDHG